MRDWIRASEIQAYGYCARSWWLRYVLELDPADPEEMETGTGRHWAHGRQVIRAEGFRRVAVLIMLVALVLAVLAITWLAWGN